MSRPPRSSTQSLTARGHVALVEEARALGAEPVEQVAQLGQPDRVALREQPPLRRVDRRALGRRAEDRLEHLEQERLHRHDLDPLARGRARARLVRSASGTVPKRSSASARPERGAVGAARRRPDVEALDGVLGEAHVDRHELGGLAPVEAEPGRGDEEVEQVVLRRPRARA